MLTGCSVLAALLGWFLADTLYRRKPELPAKMAASSRALYGLVVEQVLDRRDLRIPDRQATADRLPLHSLGRIRSRRHRRRRPRSGRRNAGRRRRAAPHPVRQYSFLRRLARHRRGGHPAALLLRLWSASSTWGSAETMTSIDRLHPDLDSAVADSRRCRRRAAARAGQARAELGAARRAGHLRPHTPSAHVTSITTTAASNSRSTASGSPPAHPLSPRRRWPLHVAGRA